MKAIVNGKIILCRDMDEAVTASNAIAPEHLELCVEDPFALEMLEGRFKEGDHILASVEQDKICFRKQKETAAGG